MTAGLQFALIDSAGQCTMGLIEALQAGNARFVGIAPSADHAVDVAGRHCQNDIPVFDHIFSQPFDLAVGAGVAAGQRGRTDR
jgi:hypothetical protein